MRKLFSEVSDQKKSVEFSDVSEKSFLGNIN